MLLVKGQKIAGYPATEIRRLMQRIGPLNASVRFIGEILGCSPREAATVTEKLRNEGYVRDDDGLPGCLCLTSKGLALLGATSRPISRATAQKHLRELLRRIPTVNADPMQAFTVGGVVVFGSFLSAKEKLGDLDVAVYLEMKQQTDEEYSRRMDKLLEQAWREGRTPSNLVEASCWPRLEILRILRRGLRQLRLHEISGLQRLHALECCVVFGNPDAVKAVLPNARIRVLHISEN